MTWQQSTKGPLAAQLAAACVQVGDGAVWVNNRHSTVDAVWLVGEWRSSGERKYCPLLLAAPYLAPHPDDGHLSGHYA